MMQELPSGTITVTTSIFKSPTHTLMPSLLTRDYGATNPDLASFGPPTSVALSPSESYNHASTAGVGGPKCAHSTPLGFF